MVARKHRYDGSMHELAKKLLSVCVVVLLSVTTGCDGDDEKGEKTDGANVETKSPTGTGTRIEAGGAVVEAGPGGTRVDDGQGNSVEASGAGAVVQAADGSSVTVDKDGNVKIEGADGKTVNIDAAGGAAVK
jgi:hypothetical protein